MTLLSADKQLDMKAVEDAEASVRAFPMTASTTIYKGSLVSMVVSTGLAIASINTTNSTTYFVGIAAEQMTSAATGTTYIKVYTRGVFRLTHDGGIVATSIMYRPTILDSGTLSATATTTTIVPGPLVIEFISATEAWCDLDFSKTAGTL